MFCGRWVVSWCEAVKQFLQVVYTIFTQMFLHSLLKGISSDWQSMLGGVSERSPSCSEQWKYPFHSIMLRVGQPSCFFTVYSMESKCLQQSKLTLHVEYVRGGYKIGNSCPKMTGASQLYQTHIHRHSALVRSQGRGLL